MSSDLYQQLHQSRLTTALILYHMPDYPDLLQTFVWQQLDRAPDFPTLKKFLDFWEKNLEGRLYSITVSSVDIIKPSELTFRQGEFLLH